MKNEWPSQFERTISHKKWHAFEKQRTHLKAGRGASLASFPSEERDAALVWRAILAQQLCSLKWHQTPHKSFQRKQCFQGVMYKEKRVKTLSPKSSTLHLTSHAWTWQHAKFKILNFVKIRITLWVECLSLDLKIASWKRPQNALCPIGPLKWKAKHCSCIWRGNQKITQAAQRGPLSTDPKYLPPWEESPSGFSSLKETKWATEPCAQECSFFLIWLTGVIG